MKGDVEALEPEPFPNLSTDKLPPIEWFSKTEFTL